jgi:glycosyltransferase involved in cell wall biosynthesis
MLNKPMSKPRQKGKVQGLCFSAAFNEANGYGEMSKCFLRAMNNLLPLSIETESKFRSTIAKMGMSSKLVGSYLLPQHRPDSYFSIQPIHPDMRPPIGTKNAIYTMFESSKVHEDWANVLRRYDLILTPNSYNAATLGEQTGVPCHATFLGCDQDLYHCDVDNLKSRLGKKKHAFTFGAAGHLAHGRSRKGFCRIVDWFQSAFPYEQNVRLRLKANEWGENNFASEDDRISFVESNMTNEQCAEWLRGIDCYIDGSTFEGWGMWTHSAMATGRPVIGTNYSARSDYFRFGNHIPIGYTIEPARDIYVGLGHWAMPSKYDAVQALQWAFTNRKQCVEVGRAAYETTKHLTWDAAARNIVRYLRQYDIIGNRVLL